MRPGLEQLREDEGGFTIVESIIALMLIMMVLVGSLGMMGASVKGIVTSRQRSVATSLAREVVERSRAATYAAVGHDLNDDTGLNAASDPALSGTPLTFEGKALASSTVDKDPDSPFFPHKRTEIVGSITYTTWAYATKEVPLAGDAYKRVTVIVKWGNDQHNGAVKDTVRIESQIFDALEPPDPLLLGEAEVDAGAVRVLDSPQPVLGDDRLTAATLFLPFARGEVESRFVRTIRSSARSARTELRTSVSSGLNAAAPCTKTNLSSGSHAECAGTATDLIADNDAGTAPVAAPAPLSTSIGGGTIARGNGELSLVLGASNAATSVATAASTAVGNNDELPYVKSTASGPATYSMPFAVGSASGSLATFSAPVTAEATVDREGITASSTIKASTSVAHPAIDLLTFAQTPMNSVTGTSSIGYAGMVRAGAASVAMSHSAGPSAASPTFTGAAFTVSLFQTSSVTGAGSNRSVTVTPGAAATEMSTASFIVNGQPVSVTATLTAVPKLVVSDTSGNDTLVSSTRLSSWLKIRLDVSAGTNQFSYELDYGRVVADARYEVPS